jgi:hypothetical protein
MSSGVQVYTPQVSELRIGKDNFADSATSLVVNAGLDGVPTMQIDAQPPIPGADVRVLDAAEALSFYTEMAASAQAYAFSRTAAEPDTTARFKAGRGEIEFKGYFSGSLPKMGVSEAGYGVAISGAESVLSMLDFTAYQVLPVRKDTFLEAAVGGQVTSWKQMMLQILKVLVSEGRSTLNLDSFSAKELERSLERNKVALPFLFSIIERSETPFLDRVLEASAGPSGEYPSMRALAAWVGMTALSVGQGGAWGWLMAQARAWGLHYVPELGGVGKLVEASALLDQEPKKMEVDAQQLDTAFVMSGILPTTRIVVMYTSEQKMPDSIELPNTQQNIVGAWPEDGLPVAGTVIPIPPPPWMEALQSAPPPLRSENGFDFRTLSSWDAELVKASGFGAERISQILSWWARTAYRWDSLIQSTADITGMPLDGKFTVGQMLTVTAGGGKPVTGLVSRVSHTLASSESGGMASTSLGLTHCRFGDFLPPGW